MSGTLDLLSSVSQELMNFTLTIPGVSEGGGGREGGREGGWGEREGRGEREKQRDQGYGIIMALDDGKYRAIIPGDMICVSYMSMFIHKCCIRFHLVD